MSPHGRSPARGDEREIDLSELERSLRRPRSLLSFCLSVLCGGLTLLAAVPLFSVLIMLIWRGGRLLSLELLTALPPAAGMVGGGIGNAIVGTLLVVAIAALISVPIGVSGGMYVAEVDPESPVSALVRFCAKLLTGLPSIIAGVFAYSTVVLLTGGFSPIAGGVALALLMLPIILLTTEEALRAVSSDARQAALAMGATQTQLIFDIVLPSALPGISTGILLALSRAAGETAPLLFTMAFSDYWISHQFMEPTASLAVLIFNLSKSPFENQKAVAWAAALVLVLIALCLNLLGQALARRGQRR
jgi:phosphate transport system permease protein